MQGDQPKRIFNYGKLEVHPACKPAALGYKREKLEALDILLVRLLRWPGARIMVHGNFLQQLRQHLSQLIPDIIAEFDCVFGDDILVNQENISLIDRGLCIAQSAEQLFFRWPLHLLWYQLILCQGFIVDSFNSRKTLLRRRIARILRALRGLGVPKDIVVVTEQDVRQNGDNHSLVMKPALEEGKELYRAAG